MVTTDKGRIEILIGNLPGGDFILNQLAKTIGFAQIMPDVLSESQGYLKDVNSPYYLGPEFENYLGNEILNYDQIQDKLHHDPEFSIKAEGVILAMYEKAWRDAGIELKDRPDILATLFNIGFREPHPNPQSGGYIITLSDGEKINFGDFAKMWASNPENVPIIKEGPPKLLDAEGNVIGSIVTDENGDVIGAIDENGDLVDSEGNKIDLVGDGGCDDKACYCSPPGENDWTLCTTIEQVKARSVDGRVDMECYNNCVQGNF